jgi:hypothetical protein
MLACFSYHIRRVSTALKVSNLNRLKLKNPCYRLLVVIAAIATSFVDRKLSSTMDRTLYSVASQEVYIPAIEWVLKLAIICSFQ